MAASGALSAVTTWVCIAQALRRNLLDHPNERSSHTQPVPRVGGIGIAVGFLLPFAVLVHFAVVTHGVRGWAMLAALAGMAGVGLLDDFRNLAASRKYLLQVAIAGLLIWSGIVVREFSLPAAGTITLGWLAVPLTLVWLTGFTNFFNFMDGTNGMAGGTAAIYGGFFAAFAYQQRQPELAMVGLLMIGSSVGFLLYNFPRAKTFMGDTGSLLLGLAAAMMVASAGQNVVALLMLCSVYIYDCVTTIFNRLGRGENIFEAHRSHHYQRLARAWGHTRVAWLYFAIQVAAGSLGLMYLQGGQRRQMAALAVTVVMLLGLSGLVRVAESGAEAIPTPASAEPVKAKSRAAGAQ